MATTLSTEDLVTDRTLAEISSSLRFLLDVTPSNLMEARDGFLNDGVAPSFTYGPLGDDPDVTEARLDAVTPADVEDEDLLQLVVAKRRELQLQLEMLRVRGTARFLELSIELYGTVSPALLGEAEALLQLIPAPGPEGGARLDAEAFAARAEEELDHYRAVRPDLSVHVEIREDSSGVMVSNGDLLIAPTMSVAESRVRSLLQHEIGTHVVTYVNGVNQPLTLLGAGLAGFDETQEGLAVFAEYLADGLTARRVRQLAARVVAVHEMVQGADFTDVHAQLVRNGVGSREAFTITMRVFRSGGLTKDAVYLRGLVEIIGHVGSGGSLDVLWLGKMPLGAVPHVETLYGKGVLRDPLLLPRYLADPATEERLARIEPRTSVTDLIGRS